MRRYQGVASATNGVMRDGQGTLGALLLSAAATAHTMLPTQDDQRGE